MDENMMFSAVIRDPDVPLRFANYVNELKMRLGPTITYGDGPSSLYSYTVSRPVSSFHLLAEDEYERARREFKMESAKEYEPSIDAYSQEEEGKNSDLIHFYRSKPTVERDTSLGFWYAIQRNKAEQGMGAEEDYEAHVFLCTERIAGLAKRLESDLYDVPKSDLERAVFDSVALHEIGHHFMLANQSLPIVRKLTQVEMDGIADSRISEGLANTFAYLMGDVHTRRALCQIAVGQGLSYRLFLFLKHADITSLLGCFAEPGGYSRAPWALGHVFGGKLNLNGFGVHVKGRYDGVAFDWSGLGGRILAGGGIRALTTMLDGCFITPRIDLLVGRFPSRTLVVVNSIASAPDYGTLPSNILVLPREKVDLDAVIARNIESKDPFDSVFSILADVGLDDETANRFRSRSKEIDDDIRRFPEGG